MNKISQVALSTLAAMFVLCSCDDSSSPTDASEKKTSSVTHEDSSRVIVYSYDEIIGKNDISILDADTTKLSIDKDFAKKADERIPEPGNVLVVWKNIKDDPFYVRVASVSDEDDHYKVKVDRATPFEALPEGDYNLSSEVFIDMSEAKTNAAGDVDVPVEAFYDKKNNTYHPVIITKVDSDDNGDAVESEDVEKTVYDEALEKDGFVDLRELVKENASIDKKILSINKLLQPGVLGIPGMGLFEGDYQGSAWTFLTKGREGLEKAFEKNKGKNPSSAPIKAYIRIDTVKFQAGLNFHMGWKLKWLKPKKFDFYISGNQDTYISDFGLGLGGGFSGEKNLTNLSGSSFTFWIGVVPVRVTIKPNIYLKYNFDAFTVLDYRMQYHRSQESKIGFKWVSGDGFSMIKEGSESFSINKPKNFLDFVNMSEMTAVGKGSLGLYLRVVALLYGVGGPSVGLGARLDMKAQVATESPYDKNGNWTNSVLVSDSTYFNLQAALALEAGGEVSLLGKTLFKRSYDVYDIKKWTLLDYKK